MDSPFLLCLSRTQNDRCFDGTLNACIDGAVWSIAGLVMACFFRNAAPPFFMMGAFTTMTRLVVNCVDAFDQSTLFRIKQVVSKIQRDYPGITIVGLLFSCVVCTVLPTTGMVLGSCVGIMHGIHRSVQSVPQS